MLRDSYEDQVIFYCIFEELCIILTLIFSGQTDNQAGLPVPGGYNPYKNANDSKNSNNEAQKLKKTVQTLEASLSKKNKEISELKKAKHESDENTMETLAEVIARFVNSYCILD